jgi:tetratricopeptide (TPR) repeat protein
VEPRSRTIFIRRFFARAILALICVCPKAYAAAPPQWSEIRSPHFSVYTDAGDKRGREVALRFEQMRVVFGSLMTKAKVNTATPLQIVAFRNTKELRQFAPLWKGKPTEVSGLFFGSEDRTYILLDMSAANPWQVVFHEYGHQLMNGTVGMQMDPWFEEGFAEYFSSIEVDDKEALVGKLSDDTYTVVRNGGMMKIADLFKVRHDSQTYNESGDHRTTFYASSSAVVHYLFDNNLIPKVGVYFDLTMKNVPMDEAMQKAFGMNSAQFDKALREYVNVGRFRYYKIDSPGRIDTSTFPALPLATSEAKAVLAEIHVGSPDYREKAIAECEEVLKTEPNNATALRALGYAYLRQQDLDKAGEYFKLAARANSKDYRVHYYSALTMSRDKAYSDPSLLDEMTKDLELSISLNPDFADSYMLLAFAQSYAGDTEKGLKTAQKGISLSPRNENHQLTLAQIYLRNRQPDQALPLLQSLKHSSDPQIASEAVRAIEHAEELKNWMAQQKHNDADQKPKFSKSVGDEDSEPYSLPDADVVEPASKPEPSVVKFLKGTLVEIDCSAPPGATLTVASGPKTMQLKVTNAGKVVLLGADKFSCEWKKQKVAINYREQKEGGTVISLELQ